MQPVVQITAPPGAIGIKDAAKILGSHKILRLARAAGWIAPIIQSHRLTRFDYQECIDCWKRLTREGLNALREAASGRTGTANSRRNSSSPHLGHSRDRSMHRPSSPNSQPHDSSKNQSTERIRGLWQHRNGFWHFSRMRKGVKQHFALKTKDKEEAEKLARRIIHSLENNSGPLSEWRPLVASFIQYKKKHNEFSEGSAMQRPDILNKFKRWMDTKGLILQLVTTDDIHEYYRDELKTIKEVTVQSYINSCLRPFFKWLHESKLIESNPTTGLKMPKLKPQAAVRYNFCSPELRDQLLELSKNIPKDVLPADTARWISFVIHVGFEAGFRKAELCEAHPSWFNLARKSVSVVETDSFIPKMGKPRTLPMTDVLHEFLKTYPMDGKWCIAPTVKKGAAKYRYDFKRPYMKFMKWAGEELKQDLGWINIHDLRRSFASILACAGVSLYKISRWIGDTERTTAKHYAHLQAHDDQINQLRGKPPPSV